MFKSLYPPWFYIWLFGALTNYSCNQPKVDSYENIAEVNEKVIAEEAKIKTTGGLEMNQMHATKDEPTTILSKPNVQKVQAKLPVNKSSKKKTSKKIPVITFDSTVHHLAGIKSGDKFEHHFRFENTGNAPLAILNAKATCGCTMPSYPFIDIAPGESGYIGVKYNSVGKYGPQEPEIIIETNTKEKELILIMKFHVLEVHESDSIKVNHQ